MEEKEKTEKNELDDIVTYYEDGTPASDGDFSSEEMFEEISADAENKSAAEETVKKAESVSAEKAHMTVSEPDVSETVKKRGNTKNIVMICVAVLVIAAGFFTGAFLLSAGDAVSKNTERLKKTDSAYLAAVNENTELNASVKALEKSNENIEKTFDSVVEYQKEYDKLSEEYDGLKSDYDSLESDYDTLKSGYDKMNSQLEEIKKKTVTLAPGVYTVGKHISSGTYSVTGNGSMLAADGSESLKINTILDDKAYRCELSDGDVIKLETTAKFAPAEG